MARADGFEPVSSCAHFQHRERDREKQFVHPQFYLFMKRKESKSMKVLALSIVKICSKGFSMYHHCCEPTHRTIYLPNVEACVRYGGGVCDEGGQSAGEEERR